MPVASMPTKHRQPIPRRGGVGEEEDGCRIGKYLKHRRTLPVLRAVVCCHQAVLIDTLGFLATGLKMKCFWVSCVEAERIFAANKELAEALELATVEKATYSRRALTLAQDQPQPLCEAVAAKHGQDCPLIRLALTRPRSSAVRTSIVRAGTLSLVKTPRVGMSARALSSWDRVAGRCADRMSRPWRADAAATS